MLNKYITDHPREWNDPIAALYARAVVVQELLLDDHTQLSPVGPQQLLLGGNAISLLLLFA